MFTKITKEKIDKWEQNKKIEKLIKAIENEALDNYLREIAGEALIRIGGPQVAHHFIKQLKSEDTTRRYGSALMLGKIGDNSAVHPLIETLEDDEFSVRSASIIALGKLKDKRAVKPLLHALKKWCSPTEGVIYDRCVLVEALSRLGDKEAIEPLIECIGDFNAEYGDELRKKAAIALADLGETKWMEIIKGDYSYSDMMKLGESDDPRVFKLLITNLESGEEHIKDTAADALGTFGDKRAVPYLINALSNDRNIDLVRKATESLAKIGDARSFDPLIKLLEHNDDNVKIDAIKALGEFGNPNAIKQLEEFIKIDIFRIYAEQAIQKLRKNKE